MRFDPQRHGLLILMLMVAFFMVHPRAQQATPTPPTTAVTNPTGSSAAAPTTTPSEVVTNQPAVPTTEVPSPAEPPHSTEQIQWSLGVVMLIEYLKKSKYFPLLSNKLSGSSMAVVGFVAAVCTALGINMSIHGSFFDASGLDVSFSHISWVMFKDVAWQWISQQAWYVGLIKKAKDVGGFEQAPANV